MLRKKKVQNYLVGSFLIMSLKAAALEKGDMAPDVVGKNHLNENIHFSKLYKRPGYLLVFFYPKAHTPGCTAQNKSLKENFVQIQDAKISVLGVSTDSVAQQKVFHDDLALPFDLISDEDKALAKAFGVSVTFGLASRQAFLIKEGKVIWADHSAATSRQAEDVLKVVASIDNKKK